MFLPSVKFFVCCYFCWTDSVLGKRFGKIKVLGLFICIIFKDSRLRILAVNLYIVECAAHVFYKCSADSGIHCPPLFCSICQVTQSLYWLEVPRTLHSLSLAEISDCDNVRIFKMGFFASLVYVMQKPKAYVLVLRQ